MPPCKLFCLFLILFWPRVLWANMVELMPRVTLWGFAGDRETVAADVLWPFYSGANTFWFLEGQAKAATDSAWAGSLGLGLRHRTKTQGLLGSYLFVDSNISQSNHSYWFLNPGVEWIGKVWEVRANAYIPLGNRGNWLQVNFAENLGNYRYVNFQGHTQIDAYLSEAESVGWGIDTELGRAVPGIAKLRLYAGAYHFNPEQAAAMNGVAARLEYPLTAHLTLSWRDSYDNLQHHSSLLGVSFSFGNRQQAETYPAVRGMASVARGTIEPVVTRQQMLAPAVIARENIWFFQPTDGSSFQDETSCTADNPCSGFGQEVFDRIAALAPHPNCYFQPGNYPAPLALSNASLFGRSSNFRHPLQESIFWGSMQLAEETNLEEIILQNTRGNSSPIGLVLLPGSKVRLSHVRIGSGNIRNGFTTGIQMQDSVLILERESQVYALSDSAVPAVGIKGLGDQVTISMHDSQIKAEASGDYGDFSAIGIQAQGLEKNTISLTNSTVHTSVNAPSRVHAADLVATGIAATGKNNSINLKGNSKIAVTALGNRVHHADSKGIVVDSGENYAAVNEVQLADQSSVLVKTDVGHGYRRDGNAVSAVGISATTQHQGLNRIHMSGKTKLDVQVFNGESAGLGDAFSVDGIYASGNWDGANFITLTDHSTIRVNLDYIGTHSFSSHNTAGIFAVNLRGENRISLADYSAISVGISVAESGGSTWVHDEIAGYGIFASGGANDVSLQNQAAVEVSADMHGGFGDVVFLNGIGVIGRQNITRLLDSSRVAAVIQMDNTPADDFAFVSGISSNGVSNGINEITLAGHSSVLAQASIDGPLDGINTVKVNGIELQGMPSILNLAATSHIIAYGESDGNAPYVVVYGINASWARNATINDKDLELSNISAIAIAPGGEAIAEKLLKSWWDG